MKACWVDANNDCDYAKAKAHNIDAAFFDVRDPRVTRSYLEGVQNHGLDVGVYAAWNFEPQLQGGGFANWLSAQLSRFGSGAPDFPRVCVDIETHDVSYILTFLKRWRVLRPARLTDWTLEGFQGGLFKPSDVAAITASGVGVCPQFYDGQMGALGHSVILDLLIAGFPGAMLSGMYDAARLPYSWRGHAFTQGRLP